MLIMRRRAPAGRTERPSPRVAPPPRVNIYHVAVIDRGIVYDYVNKLFLRLMSGLAHDSTRRQSLAYLPCQSASQDASRTALPLCAVINARLR